MATKPPNGHFRILYFASASSYTKKSTEDLKAPLELKELFDYLEGLYPGIKKAILCSCAVTLNLNYVDADDSPEHEEVATVSIMEGDEVAIIPPVSSG